MSNADSANASKPILVLVVDDDNNFRAMLSEAFESKGLKVIEARNGSEAFALLLKESVNVVFSDAQMPGGDGFTLLREVRSHRPGIPFFLMTGLIGPLPTTGKFPDEIFRKPFSISSAVKVIKRVCNEDSSAGFTLIELVMVLLLLAVLAAVAIPNFQDFRSDARNASVKGALGGLRSAIGIARAAIVLKEDVGPPAYPTALELQANSYNGSHPMLNALSVQNKRIMDASGGVPVNPWSLSTIPFAQQSSIWDCSLLTKSFVRSAVTQSDFGWCYNQTTGEFWANSDRNATVSPGTENRF